MQPVQDEPRSEDAIERRSLSRRGVLIGSLRVAGGGGLALAVAGSPDFMRAALAQDYDSNGGGGTTRLPNTGVGDDRRTGELTAAGLAGLAAAGAAAAYIMRGSARDEHAEV